jgi:PAS domain S-box-containing protein
VDSTPSTHRLRLSSSFKSFLLIGSIFLILLAFYDRELLKVYRNDLDLGKRDLLAVVMEKIKPILAEHSKEIQDDPYYLYTLGTKENIRITLFDRNKMVISDSAGILRKGALIDLSETDLQRWELLWKGEPAYGAHQEGDKRISVYFDLLPQASSAPPHGVRLMKEASIAESSKGETMLFFLKLFGGVGLFTLGLILYRFLRELFHKESYLQDKEVKDSNPVMNAFQGLILELKEKELELEKLREQAETRADRIETFQEAILRSISSGVITFDEEKIITSFNDSAEKIFGIPNQAALGKTGAEVFGEESKMVIMLNKTIEEHGPIARAEMEVLKGVNQEKIWIGVSSSPLKGNEGEFLGTTFILTDITEIKVLQEQVELQKRLTVLGEMSAGIAHEFRNFMGTIFGYVRLLGKKVEKNPAENQMIEAIVTELKAMDHLIHELLSFGKKTPVNKGKVLLEPFFSRLMAQVSSRHRGALPEIRFEISDPHLSIHSDEILIRQAFLNLIQNAFEAMPEGGVLTLKAKMNPVEKNSMVLIQLQDSGTGIAKEHLEKIFVPFFTLKEKGTGLGLAIVHKIILSHGGRIRVESELGKGTLFQIYLPAEPFQ